MKKQPKSTQKTVTIDQELWADLHKWLKTNGAKSLGYHSKAQFSTEAVGKLLAEKKSTSLQNITIIDDHTIKLIDTQIQIDEDPRITITLDYEDDWYCSYCKKEDCEHIKLIRLSPRGIELEEIKSKFFEQLKKDYEEERAREGADIAGFP